MANNLDDYFDVDGEPRIALSANDMFTICAQMLGAMHVLKNIVEDELAELRAVSAELKIRLDERG